MIKVIFHGYVKLPKDTQQTSNSSQVLLPPTPVSTALSLIAKSYVNIHTTYTTIKYILNHGRYDKKRPNHSTFLIN